MTEAEFEEDLHKLKHQMAQGQRLVFVQLVHFVFPVIN